MSNILWIVVIAVVIYGCYKLQGLTDKMKEKKFQRQRSDISTDKVKDQWSAMIDKAKGRGDELLERVARLVKENNIPNVQLANRSLSIDRAESHPFLVVSNDRFKGYEMAIGAYDYGDRLNVMWYLIFDSPEHVESREAASRGRAVHDNISFNWRIKAGEEGYVAPEKLSMLAKQELTNYVSIVHQILKDEVEQMMDGLNLDFSKVDTHTRGFTNLS